MKQVNVMVKRVVTGAAIVAAVMTPVVLSAQQPGQNSQDQLRARQRVTTMEAILERAVTTGAESVIFQVRNIVGDQPRLLGAPRARGFRLEGYGMFFAVDVPSLTLPIVWPIRNQLADNARVTSVMLAELRVFAAQLQNAADRAELEKLIAQMQPSAVGGQAAARRGTVAAASLTPENVRVSPEVAAPSIDDPEDAYRQQVKEALVDAMLENSNGVAIGPEEWLTVAARRSVQRDPLFPADTVESNTWVARVKGSTLTDLRAQRITMEEARKLVVESEQ